MAREGETGHLMGPMKKAYLAAFRGAGPIPWFSFGSILTSYGVDRMAAFARGIGYDSDVWSFDDYTAAKNEIDRRRARGALIAGIGYSLGVSTLTWLTAFTKFDLVLCIAGSSFGQNHKLGSRTGRSVLWRNPNSALSGAGDGLGFQRVIDVIGIPHLWMDFDPQIVSGVEAELETLIKGE